MTDHNDSSKLFARLYHLQNPNGSDSFPAVPLPSNSTSPGLLAALTRTLAGPPKHKPPELSVEHMKLMLEESLRKKLDVNPGRQLPTIFDLAIGEGRELNTAFVYTDLDGYSKLLSTQGTDVGFKLLQSFVNLVEKITSHFGGAVVDCAGDRTLSVFFRPSTDRSAAPIKEATTAALWIQTAMVKVISPRFATAQIPGVSVSIGIDYGKAVAGCVGVRGNKRLVFFGDAANNAAKLQDKGVGGETLLSPLAFQYRPSFLNDSTWLFESVHETQQWKISHYKTSYHFRDDIPVGRELFLK
jgi:class 3 adenylate cyclase